MIVYLKLVLIVAFACISENTDETDWKLRKQENGIRVYTRPAGGSDFESFRAVTDIEARPDEIMEVLLNIDEVPEWTPGITKARVLHGDVSGKATLYMQYDLPWPIRDRDVVFSQHLKRDADTLWLCSTIEQDYLTKKDDFIRVEWLKGFWKLVDMGNTTRAVYQLHSDPGGKLPAWLVNWKITEAPYETLRNLQQKVE